MTDGRTLTYFISDLHLGARYIDNPRAHEQRVVSFLESIRPTARRLYMLGDVMDYWWDYRTVVPRGYVRFLGALARLADSGTEITWFKGNHDIWLFDYMQTEIGVRVIDGALTEDIGDQRFFMEHGDGVGHQSTGFRLIRSLFRNRLAQRLYASIHPRWTIGFAHSWSSHSRKAGGYAGAKGDDDATVCAPLVDFAENYLRDVDSSVNYFIFGHVHRAFERQLSPDHRVVVLGDWISRFTYAVFDGSRLTLRRFE